MHSKQVWLVRNRREKIAADIREMTQPCASEPLDPFDLSSALGINLMTPFEIKTADTSCVNNLCGSYSDEWDAFTIAALEINKIVIVYNPTKPPKRINATLMEEVSHIILDHEPSRITQQSGTFFRDYNSEQEDEAKYVGWAALLPRASLRWAIDEKLSMQDISDHFGTSPEMVSYRLNMTNLRKAHLKSIANT
ncbi:MAG: ImmA/IrrE family metallo-endopeptidase [Actinobacteria bacterium]|nr:ImmA/IrrE family metallo-endopeptidase [Actinomycetota bacterium]